jgi:hypothetical protein
LPNDGFVYDVGPNGGSLLGLLVLLPLQFRGHVTVDTDVRNPLLL